MVCTKSPALIIAPSFDQENTAFEKMVFANELVDLLVTQKRDVKFLKLMSVTEATC